MSQQYRMILVDDEDDVRGRIISKINPDSGFDIVGKAGNGYDALDLIEEHKPHVVLTDIKMPFIDGIELARIIRRDYPTTKVAFISGYDEFDLARQAIELNVVSYLMKPVTSEEIDTFLTKLKRSLDQEFDMLSNNRLIHEMYQQSIPMLINSYLSSYRYQNALSNDDVKLLEQYGISLPQSKYVVGMISVLAQDDVEAVMETKILIGNLLEKVFDHFSLVHHFLIPEGVVLVLRDDRMSSAKTIDMQLYEILKYVEQYRKSALAIGISTLFEPFHRYPTAFRECEQAARHSRYFNMGQIMYYEDIEDRELRHVQIEDSMMNDFEHAMKYGQKKDMFSQIDTLLALAITGDDGYLVDPQLLLIKIANSLINYAASINVNIAEVLPGNLIQRLNEFHEQEELRSFIYDAIIKMREKNVNLQVDKTERIIDEVYRYIEQNYDNPNISLETITTELGISVSYLSMLLKKSKGVTYTKELIRFRMEKAKELLKLTNDKIVSIAKQVGYNEVYYFSHSFKRYSGMSPKEFRDHG